MRKIYNKYGYSETVFNESRIRKLYHMYLHQTAFDKMLDVLVFFAIIVTALTVSLELADYHNKVVMASLHSFSVLVFTVFGLQLLREYATSQTRRRFFKKHWIDFSLMVFLSFYFLTGAYLGIAKLNFLSPLAEYASKFKHYKIASKIFKLRI